MKAFFTSIFFCTCISLVNAQGMKKYDIDDSGCKAYFFCDPGAAMKSYSEDSSEIYTMECNADNLHYGLICVKYSAAALPIAEPETLMIQYVDYLKQQFNITESAGYGKGHTMSSNVKATGMIDYWKDSEGGEWKIKSWTDGQFIGFMYVYGDAELPGEKTTKIDVFLNGFRFP